jgi:hypothetical protein
MVFIKMNLHYIWLTKTSDYENENGTRTKTTY